MSNTKQKAMISQPMAGFTDEEIKATRDEFLSYCERNNIEVVNTLFTDEWYSKEAMEERGVIQIPLCFLAKSLENMANCHMVYFARGCRVEHEARGCRVEHEARGCRVEHEARGCRVEHEARGCRVEHEARGCRVEHEARGCRVEHEAALAYNLNVVYASVLL